MKALALPIIAGAFSLYGSAFFEVWTAPGLEGLPTYTVVKKQLPWDAPAVKVVEKPKSEIVPISASVQFVPHGVAANWGNAPVINLPDRKPEQEQIKNAAQTAPSTTAAPKRPAAPRRVVSTPKPKSSTPVARSTSYQLAGSRTRPLHNARPSRPSYSGRGSSAASSRSQGSVQSRRPSATSRSGSSSRAYGRSTASSRSRATATRRVSRVSSYR